MKNYLIITLKRSEQKHIYYTFECENDDEANKYSINICKNDERFKDLHHFEVVECTKIKQLEVCSYDVRENENQSKIPLDISEACKQSQEACKQSQKEINELIKKFTKGLKQ